MLFRLNITFCAYLVGSALKFIFYLNDQVLILAKLLFKWFATLVIFSTIRNRDVLSGNSFGLNDKSLYKSLNPGGLWEV